MKQAHRPHARQGYTLVEMLLTVAIIAILISLIVPSLSRIRERGRAVTCATQLKQIGFGYYQYSSDYKGYVGGNVVWELRDCFTSAQTSGAGHTWYESAPWAKSTTVLPNYGIERPLTLCPSRTYSRYINKTNFQDNEFRSVTIDGNYTNPARSRLWGGSLRPPNWSLNYQDYWFFGGFGNHPTLINETNWGHYDYGWLSATQQPVVHFSREKRSPRAVLVMDRSWTEASKYSSYYYNDIGDISSHIGRPSSIAGEIAQAAGSNNLLLDGSVVWGSFDGLPGIKGFSAGGYYQYGRDYYRTFYVGAALADP